MILYLLLAILLLLLAWLARVRRDEYFINIESIAPGVDLKSLPAPQEIFRNTRNMIKTTGIDLSKGAGEDPDSPQHFLYKMNGLIDKYDKPEVWDHAAYVMDKDPGQLARMNLGITN